jgi:hypothetical protein
MAKPARRQAELDEPPVSDPAAIEHAYRYHRKRRYARIERRREDRLARLRFWLVAAGLLLVALVIGVTIWDQVQRLFGL